MRQYRIVLDAYAGYEAQSRRVLFGFLPLRWKQLSKGGYGCNTSSTIEGARALIRKHKMRGKEVYREGG